MSRERRPLRSLTRAQCRRSRPCPERWVGGARGDTLTNRRSLGAVPVDSVWERLEPLLPHVSKPVQYVGGELHAVVKDWDDRGDHEMVRWALMYPDAYEVGLPNQGVQILYE